MDFTRGRARSSIRGAYQARDVRSPPRSWTGPPADRSSSAAQPSDSVPWTGTAARCCSAHRSEEHTSELQSHLNLVCRLLLEKKKHTSELQSHLNLVCRLLLV